MAEAQPRFRRPDNFNAADLFDNVLRRSPPRAIFIELGANEGRSAWYLGQAIRKSGKPIKLITVDHFSTPGDPKLESDCRRNLAPLIESGIVEVVKCDSADYATQCPHERVDFVYVDAGHRYEDVKRDILAWLPKIRPGGYMAGDDFWWRPKHQQERAFRQVPDVEEYPVWRAVDECFSGKYELIVRDSWAVWLRGVGP